MYRQGLNTPLTMEASNHLMIKNVSHIFGKLQSRVRALCYDLELLVRQSNVICRICIAFINFNAHISSG